MNHYFIGSDGCMYVNTGERVEKCTVTLPGGTVITEEMVEEWRRQALLRLLGVLDKDATPT